MSNIIQGVFTHGPSLMARLMRERDALEALVKQSEKQEMTDELEKRLRDQTKVVRELLEENKCQTKRGKPASEPSPQTSGPPETPSQEETGNILDLTAYMKRSSLSTNTENPTQS